MVVHPLNCLIFTVEIHQHTHLYQYMNNPESKYLVTVDEIMVKPQNSPYLTGVVFKGESIGNHGIYMFFFQKTRQIYGFAFSFMQFNRVQSRLSSPHTGWPIGVPIMRKTQSP